MSRILSMLISLRRGLLWRGLIVLLAACFLWPCSAVLTAEPGNDALNDSYRFIDEVFAKLQTEALERRTTWQLVNSGIKAVSEYVKQHKLDAGFIKPAPSGCSEQQAKDHLRRVLRTTATAYPNLNRGQRLTLALADGVMRSYDSYTVCVSPDDYTRTKRDKDGVGCGDIGVILAQPKKNSPISVVKVISNTPASRVGMRPHDTLIKIDNRAVDNISLQDAHELLRGEPGSIVTLLVRRGKSVIELAIKRKVLSSSLVDSASIVRQGHKIGLIAISSFHGKTSIAFRNALSVLERKNVEGYIIDLRGNGGGFVSEACDVCSQFLPEGKKIVTAETRNSSRSFVTRPNGSVCTKPLVICIDGDSASAAEIMAGALRNLNRAVLVGCKTFGKDTIQDLYSIKFPGGKEGALKMTVARYSLFGGRSIKNGINPDIAVDAKSSVASESQDDACMLKAVEVLLKKLPSSSQ